MLLVQSSRDRSRNDWADSHGPCSCPYSTSMADTSEQGASTSQQLLYAAKTDSTELCEECLKDAQLDVNATDGLGMTGARQSRPAPCCMHVLMHPLDALSPPLRVRQLSLTMRCRCHELILSPRSACLSVHCSVKSPSPEVLELLLDDERTDVDPQTKLDGDTPLHLAVKLDHPEARTWMVKTLLEAGADPSIRNKYRDKAVDLLPKGKDGDELREELQVAPINTAGPAH